MTRQPLSVALKEWALAQRAMLEGRQILLLRKGGLIEETSLFELRARTFLIQPTYIHETERGGDIQPQYLDWLREEESRRTPQGTIRFEAVCDVEGVCEVKHPEPLIAISDQHIYSEKFIRNRLDWEPYKPLYAVIVRAYRLRETVEIPADPDYYGCKSWIDLNAGIPTDGALPAIENDDQFRARAESIRERLGFRAQSDGEA